MDGPLGLAPVSVAQTNGSFRVAGKTTRSDVAAVCVAAALSPDAVNTTFELDAGAPGEEPVPIAETLFAELKQGWGEEWTGGVDEDPRHCC